MVKFILSVIPNSPDEIRDALHWKKVWKENKKMKQIPTKNLYILTPVNVKLMLFSKHKQWLCWLSLLFRNKILMYTCSI